MNFTVFSHDSSFYGAPQSIFLLTNELKRLGHHVNYILPDSDGLFYQKLIENNYTVTILPNPSWTIAERKPGYSKWFYFKHKTKKRIELISKFFLNIRSYRRLIKKHSTDFIIVNTSVAPYGLILGRLFNIRTIVFVREVLGNDEMNLKLIVPKCIVKSKLKNSFIIIGPSVFIGSYFTNNFGVTNFNKILNPIKIEFLLQKKTSQFNNPILSFGLVGSLSINKGQSEFIKEAVKNNHTITHVFGEGNNKMLQFIYNQQQLHPKKLKFHGYVNALESIYTQFEYYINLGKNESFGRTTIEAMSAGCIVFGRRSGATPELINHGVNGFLFDEIFEIFEILNEYHSEGRHEELKTIQSNAVEFSKEFSSQKIAQQFLLLLNSKSGNFQNKSQ